MIEKLLYRFFPQLIEDIKADGVNDLLEHMRKGEDEGDPCVLKYTNNGFTYTVTVTFTKNE